MKNIFVDTNVLIDIVCNRPGCAYALKLLSLSGNDCNIHISTLTMANMAYILRKSFKLDVLYDKLKLLSDCFMVDSLSSMSYYLALELRAKDFEDALQYFCAVENECDYIITNNIKDFSYSKLPVMSAKEYIIGKSC